MLEKQEYVPDWRIDTIDEGQQAAKQAEDDHSNRDRAREASGSGSDHSIYRYKDKD